MMEVEVNGINVIAKDVEAKICKWIGYCSVGWAFCLFIVVIFFAFSLCESMWVYVFVCKISNLALKTNEERRSK